MNEPISFQPDDLYLATHRSSEILQSVTGVFGQGTPTSFRSVGQSVRQTKLWLLEFNTTSSGKLLSKACMDSSENSMGKGCDVAKPSSNLSQRNCMIGMAWLTSHTLGLWESLVAMNLANVCRFWTEAVCRDTWCLRDRMPPLWPMSKNRVRRSTTTCAFKLRYLWSRQAKLMKICIRSKTKWASDCHFEVLRVTFDISIWTSSDTLAQLGKERHSSSCDKSHCRSSVGSQFFETKWLSLKSFCKTIKRTFHVLGSI